MNKVRNSRGTTRVSWWWLPVVGVLFYGIGAVLGGDNDNAKEMANSQRLNTQAGVDTHGSHAHDPHTDKATSEVWSCSMHPQVRQSSPGKCPLCGMDLIPVTKAGGASGSEATRVSLSQSAKIRARIVTSPVSHLDTAHVERHLLGRVDYDETSLRTISAWTGGRIESLLVSATGQKVRRGQVIARLYSPEIYSAHQDLIQARRQLQRLSGASSNALQASNAALQASRNRLRLLGVPQAEVAEMEQGSVPTDNVAIRTPYAGTVIERLATEGNYITTGAGLYKIADLSRLWVQLDAYESDLPLLRVGQQVSLTVEALPSKLFGGRVTFVDPVLNRRSRTARVRIEVSNRDGRLRPGMFAEATVQVGSSKKSDQQMLVIPATAPLFTGRRSLVYVEVPDTDTPTYDARVVRLGSKRGNFYPVLAGLALGERVVVRGSFTLDADLQIRGGAAMMTVPDDKQSEAHMPGVTVPSKFQKPLAQVVEHYLRLHQALAQDSLAKARSAARNMEVATEALRPSSVMPFYSAWMPIARQVHRHTRKLIEAKKLDGQRLNFRDLSHQVATLLRVLGNPLAESLRLASCPMALGGKGAEWIQKAAHIQNPYFGPAMHSCGEVHTTVAHGTYLPLAVKPKATKPLTEATP